MGVGSAARLGAAVGAGSVARNLGPSASFSLGGGRSRSRAVSWVSLWVGMRLRVFVCVGVPPWRTGC